MVETFAKFWCSKWKCWRETLGLCFGLLANGIGSGVENWALKCLGIRLGGYPKTGVWNLNSAEGWKEDWRVVRGYVFLDVVQLYF